MSYNYNTELKKLSPETLYYIEQDKDLQQHIQKYKLDAEEIQSLIETEKGERETIPNFDEEKAKLVLAAKNTIKEMKKKKQLTIRLPLSDIIKLKTKAAEEGIPYQTLLGSIVHKALS